MTLLPSLQRTALTFALCAAFSVGHAKTVEQVGAAPQQLPALTSYGVDVGTRSALKSVVPAGWQLFVHKQVTLPESVSWRTGITWADALTGFVADTDIAVLIDWDKRSVYFRPEEISAKERQTREEVRAAATTPLPTSSASASVPSVVGGAVQLPAASVSPGQVAAIEAQIKQLELALEKASQSKITQDSAVAERVTALETSVNAKAVELEAAKAELVAAKAAAAAAEKAAAQIREELANTKRALSAPVALAAEPSILPTGAVGSLQDGVAKTFNRVPLSTVVSHLAMVHGLQVSDAVPGAVLRGAVTVMGVEPGEDAKLLFKSLGESGGVNVTYFRGNNVLQLSAPVQDTKATFAVREEAFAGVVAGTAPIAGEAERNAPARYVAQTQVAAGDVPTAAPVSAAVAAPMVNAPSAQAAAPLVVQPSPTKMPPAPRAHVALSQAGGEAEPLVAPPVPKGDAKPMFTLHIGAGEDLQTAVTTFLKDQGFEVRWTIEDTFEAAVPFEASGTIVEILSKLLPKLGLSADIQTDARRVTVRHADPVRDSK